MNRAWSAGKLLLSGEYWVLHGAESLSVPTLKGQSLEFQNSEGVLHWTARDNHGHVWLDTEARRDPHLITLLDAALVLGGTVPDKGSVTTRLEFDRSWGWGSSSTLTDLIAQWTGVDAMALHFATSKGSGFDVASARADGPIMYRKTGDASAEWQPVASSHWPIAHLGLVYLGAKQDSQLEVAKVRRTPLRSELDTMSQLSHALAAGRSVEEWSAVADELEARTAEWIGAPRVQERFPHAPATLKSLGAWGGDFALAICPNPDDLAYFSQKGFLTLPWSDCVHLP
jgi:mevalonate kinase